MADLAHLDSTALKNFKNNDGAGFFSDLLEIRKDTAGIRSLKNLVAKTGDRARDARLTEGEDVWGTDEGGSPAVIGQ